MAIAVLSQVEKTINRLSYEKQLWLIEQLAHRLREDLRKRNIVKQPYFEKQLATMAMDSEIQSELQRINQEFMITETDGLENR